MAVVQHSLELHRILEGQAGATEEELRLAFTDAARAALVAVQGVATDLQAELEALSVREAPTSRAEHLAVVHERLGELPTRSWRDEWDAAAEETRTIMKLDGLPAEQDRKVTATVERWLEEKGKNVAQAVDLGWDAERARTFFALHKVKPALSMALRDRDATSCQRYAASTYELCKILGEQATIAHGEQAQAQNYQTPKPLYTHLTGPSGLTLVDAKFGSLETPDSTGFRGLTCTALVTADCDAARFSEGGHCYFKVDASGAFSLEAVDSPVVRFEPSPEDENGAHSAVMFADVFGAFPPTAGSSPMVSSVEL